MSEPMESAQMRDHLARVHGIIIKEQKKRKTREVLAPLSPNKASRTSKNSNVKKYKVELSHTGQCENKGERSSRFASDGDYTSRIN
jgi:hypothetical protein